MGVKVDDLEVDLRARFDKLGRDLDQAERRWGGYSTSATTQLRKVAVGAAALVGGVAALSSAWRVLSGATAKALTEAQNQEKAIGLLNSQLRTSGQFSDSYSKKLQSLASQFQRVSTVGDDVTLGIIRQLTAFGASEKNIERLTGAVLDLSAGLGTDLNAAALLVGKALSGEFGSLSRYGIIIDKNADSATKLELALAGIEARFGGAAQAEANAFSGALKQLANNTGDVYEEFGRLVTDSVVVRRAITELSSDAADVATKISEWREANQELIDQNLQQWADGLGSAMRAVAAVAEATLPRVAGLVGEVAAQFQALELYQQGRIDVTSLMGAYFRNAVPGGGSDNFRDLVSKFYTDERRQFGEVDPRAQALLDALDAPDLVGPPRPRSIAGAGKPNSAGKTTVDPVEPGKGKTAREYLADVARDQDAFFAAADSRLQNQIQLLTEAGDQTGQIAALEAQILALRERSLQSQLALAEAQGLSAGELATLSAELENARDNIAASTGPAREVADGFVAATEAARDLGTTLRTDVLSSVKQIVVGIAQGTTDLKDFPSRFAQAATGQIVSRGFDAVLGDGGLFGSGTGAGDAGGFLSKLGGAFGLPTGNAPPEGFTGPPLPNGTTSTTGFSGFAQQAGAVLGPSLAIGGFASQIAGLFGDAENAAGAGIGGGIGAGAGMLLGGPIGALIGGALGGIGGGFLGSLFGGREPSAKERRRESIGDAFKSSNLFPTLAFAKDPTRNFLDATQPGFIGGLSGEIGALSLLLGGTLEDARNRLPGTIGARASVAGLDRERVRRELRTVAADSGVSLDDAVFDLTNRFLRFQQEGKGASINQREYNDLLAGTVSIFADDLPLGIDATIGAMGALERFGDQQIANLEDLRETLADTAAAAQGFAAGVTSGIRAAIDSGDITDVSESLAKSFSSTFVDRVVADIVEGQALGESLTRAVDLQREISSAFQSGDFARAAVLQGQLSDTFAQANAKILTESAPIVQSLRGFQSSIGAQNTPGVIRQVDTINLQIDGRTLASVNLNNDRLQRTGGVVTPQQVGTKG